MSPYPQHQSQSQRELQQDISSAPPQAKKQVFTAYDNRNIVCCSSWFQTIAVGLGAIAALYYPMIDIDVLEEATAADATGDCGVVKATGRFIYPDDIDAVLLDDLSFRRRR